MEILEWEKRDKSGGIDRSSVSLEGQGWKGHGRQAGTVIGRCEHTEASMEESDVKQR